jgi:hypothetical protein
MTLNAHPATVSRLRTASRLLALGGGLAAFLFPLPGRADSVIATWQGGPTGAWSTAANWTPTSAFPDNGNGGNTFSATISTASVALTEDIALDGLSLIDTTLSGAFTLTSGFSGTTLSGSNTLSNSLTLAVAGPFAFADNSASLTNHGTLQFETTDASTSYIASNATLTNASDGLIRFNPSSGISVGNSSTSPFSLSNAGTVLADNGSYNYLYAPVSQSAGGLIRATNSTYLSLNAGGTLAGTLQADDDTSTLILYGYDKTYTLDQLATSGTGTVSAYGTTLTGSLASGSLSIGGVQLSGSFTNQSAATLRWNGYTSFADSSASLTNHGTLRFETTDASTSYTSSNATLTNASDGLIRFNPASGTSVGDSSTSPFSLVNQGTVLADNGSFNALYTPVSQSASGRLRAGSSSDLGLWAGGTLSGTLQADDTSTIALFGYDKTYTLDQLATSGTGTVGAYSTTITGSLASGSLSLNYATLAGSFTNQSAATLSWNNGTRFANSSASLTNHGTLQFSSYIFPLVTVASTASITNAADGLIRFLPPYGVFIGGDTTSPFSLINSGTILADDGSYDDLFVPLTQSASGLIRATSGSHLAFGSGGTLAGTLQADNNSVVGLFGDNKTYTLDQLSTTGTGSVRAGFANFTGSLASGSLLLYKITLTGSFTSQPGATLLWTSGNRFADNSASLTNHGTLQFGVSGFTNGANIASTATLTNSSTGLIRFDPTAGISVGDSATSPFSLVNAGTILADNGNANSIYAPVANTGLIRVTSGSSLALAGGFTQTAGEVRVENAALSAGPGQTLTFQGGLLRASGSISANLSLATTALEIGLAQTSATLSLSGNLTLLAGTSASFDLNGRTPGTGYDFLSVNGGVTFGGDLSLRLSASLAATLTAGDSFTLISATSFSGSFANIQSGQRLTLAADAGSFLVTLTGTALTLSDFAPPASPFESFLIAAGVPANQRAATDDPDADGVPNLLEFALGLAPLTPDSDGLPLLAVIGGNLTLTYDRAQPAAVTYTVETTTDLATPASWSATGVAQGTPAGDGLTTASIPLGTGPRFLRLNVTLNP